MTKLEWKQRIRQYRLEKMVLEYEGYAWHSPIVTLIHEMMTGNCNGGYVRPTGLNAAAGTSRHNDCG